MLAILSLLVCARHGKPVLSKIIKRKCAEDSQNDFPQSGIELNERSGILRVPGTYFRLNLRELPTRLLGQILNTSNCFAVPRGALANVIVKASACREHRVHFSLVWRRRCSVLSSCSNKHPTQGYKQHKAAKYPTYHVATPSSNSRNAR